MSQGALLAKEGRVTPRSDPHTEAIREALEMFRDYFVLYDETERRTPGVSPAIAIANAALAALAALESERDGLDEDFKQTCRQFDDYVREYGPKLVAAEARVTQIRQALAAMRSMALSGEPYSQQMQTLVEDALGLGVVADGGGGRDDE